MDTELYTVYEKQMTLLMKSVLKINKGISKDTLVEYLDIYLNKPGSYKIDEELTELPDGKTFVSSLTRKVFCAETNKFLGVLKDREDGTTYIS